MPCSAGQWLAHQPLETGTQGVALIFLRKGSPHISGLIPSPKPQEDPQFKEEPERAKPLLGVKTSSQGPADFSRESG